MFNSAESLNWLNVREKRIVELLLQRASAPRRSCKSSFTASQLSLCNSDFLVVSELHFLAGGVDNAGDNAVSKSWMQGLKP
ncbi:hypothetical protein KR51_00029180 [Rubidibacter lacunae KORDI 51-2]|uniref:Uncharacterized protein n=1 Tax=Rubidibacter lacunae KORDI 51-2 TaxID=582515 RepID=U5DFK8_9CHRO|nr:hypothetical protein KR51_00029180 [Rubidibacter lacunae KORDI 51-2]